MVASRCCYAYLFVPCAVVACRCLCAGIASCTSGPVPTTATATTTETKYGSHSFTQKTLKVNLYGFSFFWGFISYFIGAGGGSK